MAIPYASATDDDLKSEQKQVQRDLKSAHADLDGSSAAVLEAAARVKQALAALETARGVLSGARAKVSAARLRDQELQDQLEKARARLEAARVDLDLGAQQVDEQREEVANTISSIYEQGDPTMLGLASLLDAKDPDDITRRLSYMDTVVDEETRTYDDLQAAEVLLKVRETQVEDAERAVADRRREAAAHLVEMQGLEAAAESAAESVRQSVRNSIEAKQSALAARKADRAELAKLRQREERIKQRILAAARAAAKDKNGYRGDTSGLLNLPVDGPVTSAYGYRVHPIYGYYSLHDGTDFGAGCGQQLWAVANGRVTDAYYSSVWGNRLYVDLGTFNGKNVTVIYNHLSNYRASVGERVARGETIGYVGTTGWSTGCHLHFTVLVNGVPVNPMGWIGS